MITLSSLLAPFAKRFVAGEEAEDAIAAAQAVNDQNMIAIIDFLGEDVLTAEDAKKASEEYANLIHLIHAHGLRATVSVKASQMGLLISEETCIENMARVLAVAAKHKIFVWMDMEGSALTQRTVDVFDKLRSATHHIGLCLQAYLVRTGADLDRLMRRPLNVRLCKGAYKEPATIAFASKRAVDGNYRMLAQKLMDRSAQHIFSAFATHDPYLIQFICALAAERRLPTDTFEFQMLYGVQNKKLQALALQGYRASVYIPYGKTWLPYFLRRLRERRENVYFLLRNILHR